MTLKYSQIETSFGIIDQVILQNPNGLCVTTIAYAASIYEIKYQEEIITAHPESIEAFLNAKLNYGRTMGRTSGRTHLSPFTIEGHTYQVSKNIPGDYQLHGGHLGFSNRLFTLVDFHSDDEKAFVTYYLTSPHLEEGFPGEVNLKVTYTLYSNDQLVITYDATTTHATYLNLTNHTYFNLTPYDDILDHALRIPAKHYLLKDSMFNFKAIEPVDFIHDFNEPTTILSKQQKEGYDDVFFLGEQKVSISHPKKDFLIELETDYPCVVLYTHNLKSSNLNPLYPNKGIFSGIAIECQYAPGGIHEKALNWPIYTKDKPYHHNITIQVIKRPNR